MCFILLCIHINMLFMWHNHKQLTEIVWKYVSSNRYNAKPLVTTLFYASNYNLASQLLRFIIYIFFFTIFNTKHTNKDGRGSQVKSCWKNRCYVSHCLDLIQWAASTFICMLGTECGEKEKMKHQLALEESQQLWGIIWPNISARSSKTMSGMNGGWVGYPSKGISFGGQTDS